MMPAKKILVLMGLVLLGFNGCSNSMFMNSTDSAVVIYGGLNMEEAEGDTLQNVVVELINPAPKNENERYLFSHTKNNVFAFSEVKPNAVYELVRFEGLQVVDHWYNSVKKRITHDFNIPKKSRPTIKTGNPGSIFYFGSYRYKKLKDGYTLEKVPGNEQENFVLKKVKRLASGSTWETVFEKRMNELE